MYQPSTIVVHNETGFSLGAGAVWLVWLSFTLVLLVAGLVLAELAPRAPVSLPATA